MVQFIPKVPIISKTSLAKGAPRLESPSTQEYKPIENMSAVGISAGAVYLFLFAYAYFTAYKTGKITLKLTDHYGITISEAFEHCERIGTTILIVVFTGLYAGLMVDKGFLVEKNQTSVSVIAVSFALMLGLLLLFLIPPSKVNNIQSGIHFLVAVLIISFSTYSSFAISEIYRSEYEENDYTKTLLGLGSVAVICFFIIFSIVVAKFAFNMKKGRLYEIMFTVVGLVELMLVMVFGAGILTVSFMPDLINYETLCFALLSDP